MPLFNEEPKQLQDLLDDLRNIIADLEEYEEGDEYIRAQDALKYLYDTEDNLSEGISFLK